MLNVRSSLAILACVAVGGSAFGQGVFEARSRNLGSTGPVDFFLIDSSGVVTRQVVTTPNAAGFFAINVSSDTMLCGAHIPGCMYVKVLLQSPFTTEGAIPVFRNPDDISLLSSVDLASLSALSPPTINTPVAFANGLSSLLPGLVVRDPGIPYPLLTDAQLANTDAFNAFSGQVPVIDILDIRFTMVPAPGTAGLLLVAGMLATRRRR